MDLQDVLGLVSFLREQRDCKVVLLLNDEKLDAEARKSFNTQLEKVIDTRIMLTPTPHEVGKIGLSTTFAFHDALRNNCVTLGITNIRVVKKIERICIRLAGILSEYGDEVMKQAVHSAALFSWGHYEPETDLAPSIAFLRTYPNYERRSTDHENHTDLKAEAWSSLLAGYGFTGTDEFDLAILDGIEMGHFDAEKLKGPALTLKEKN